MNETKEIAFESLSYTSSSSELYLPKSISVPDMLFDYKTLTQGWREGGVCCAMGKFQKLPNQMAVAQRDIRSFQLSSTERSSLTQFLLDPSVGVTVLPFLSLCKGQSLQQVSEHSARTDGYVHASLPSVFREARHAATALLQESQAILDSSFLTTGPDTGNLNESDLSQEKTLIRRTNSFLD